jgi:3-hydroxybutyryl-CoA dehydrogenase
MKIAVVGSHSFFSEENLPGIGFEKFATIADCLKSSFDAIFIFTDKQNLAQLPDTAALFVEDTLIEIESSRVNCLKICGWPGFLQKPIWEVIGNPTPMHHAALQTLGKTCIEVPNQVGFVSPRVIAMIINEAFFALDDKVANTVDIDIAMKLGTNYPLGPFEWADQIGHKEVIQLLQKLEVEHTKYAPAKSLLAKFNT